MEFRGFTAAERARENQLRKMAERQGLSLRKSGDGFMLVDPTINGVVAGGSPIPFGLSLEDVQQWLTSDDQR